MHEVFPSDDALSTQCVDKSASLFPVFISPLQRTEDDLTQHLWQKMFGSFHLFHTTDSILHVLTVQILSHNVLLL